MTDNTKKLDVILERYRLRANMAYSEVEDNFHTAEEFKTLALPKVLAEAKQAILDWHNKQAEKMLDVISDLEEEAECMQKPSGDYVDVLPILHIEELREMVEGE